MVSRKVKKSLCIAKFANCFVELDDQFSQFDFCYPNSSELKNKHRKTFTFFLLVELLLGTNSYCKENSNECRLNDYYEEKKFISIIRKDIFLDDSRTEKVPFLETNATCIQPLERIRNDNFTNRPLWMQKLDIKYVRLECVNDSIVKDYIEYSNADGSDSLDCLSFLVGQDCTKGSMFYERKNLNLNNSISKLQVFI